MSTHEDREDGLFYPQTSYSSSGGDAGYGDRTTSNMPIGGGVSFADTMDDDFGPARSTPWHGGADLGLLVLRIAVGGIFIAHGLQHVFGLFHGIGIHAFAQFIGAAGFQDSGILAYVAGITELGGGALVVLGLFTPLGAAGLLGLMANVVAMKWHLGFFEPGYEYELLLGVASFALLFSGPGRVSLDRPTPWFRHPVLNGFVFLIIAAVATAAALYVFK